MTIDLSKLVSLLNNAKAKYQVNDPTFYNVIKSLIETLQALQNNKGQSDLVQAIADLQKVINALTLQGFLTWEDDAATLLNSRELIAGTNITFDDSVLNRRTISSSGGSSTTAAPSAIYIPESRKDNNLLTVPPQQQLLRSLGFIITGGTSVPTTGVQELVLRPPTGGVFVKWSIFSKTAGSAVVDILKSTYGAFSFSSITASDKPTLSSASKNEGSCAGWTTGFDQGDCFEVDLNSVTTCTTVAVILWYLPR